MTFDEMLADRVGKAISWDGTPGGWSDVLVRAALREPLRAQRRLARRGRSLLVAVVIVLVGGSLAFALDSGFVPGAYDSPAPLTPAQQMKVNAYLADGAPPSVRLSQPGPLVAGSTHVAIRLRTARFGLVLLYVGRTTHGVCYSIVRGGTSSGQCSSNRGVSGSPVVVGFDSTPSRPGSNLVDGHTISGSARSLRIRFRHGASRTVPVVSRFFLFELGPDHSQRSSNPAVALDVLDAAGRTIGTRNDPLRLEPRPKPIRPVAGSVRLAARATLPRRGGRADVRGGHDANGRPCISVRRDGIPISFAEWDCATIHHALPSWAFGSSGGQAAGVRAYAYGWVSARVALLRVRFQDGDVSTIPLHSGYFLYVIPPARWKAGHRPRLLLADDATGRPTLVQNLYPRQHCVYPGTDPLCGKTGAGGTKLVSDLPVAPRQ